MVVKSSIYPLQEPHHNCCSDYNHTCPFPIPSNRSTSLCFVYVKNLVPTSFGETSFLEK